MNLHTLLAPSLTLTLTPTHGWGQVDGEPTHALAPSLTLTLTPTMGGGRWMVNLHTP